MTERRKEDTVGTVDREVIESLLRHAHSLFLFGLGCGSHIDRDARLFGVSLVHDDDGMAGGSCVFRDRRPLDRRTTVTEVRGAGTVIRARAAPSTGCAREVFGPFVALEGCTLCRGKAVGAARAKGYRHEGGVRRRRCGCSCGVGTRRRREGRTALDGGRGFALAEAEFSRKTLRGKERNVMGL
jgi:hypothetical protein